MADDRGLLGLRVMTDFGVERADAVLPRVFGTD